MFNMKNMNEKYEHKTPIIYKMACRLTAGWKGYIFMVTEEVNAEEDNSGMIDW